MLKGRDIILISSIDWNVLWQGAQEVALRLARAGNRVLYIENTGVRTPGLRDVARLKIRLRRWAKTVQTSGTKKLADNLYLCSPLVLPPFGRGLRRFLNRHLFIPRIARAAHNLGMRDPLLWTYLPTDTAEEIIRRLRSSGSRVVYYCAADFARLTPCVAEIEQSERRVLQQSDLVFTTCSGLTRHCSNVSGNVHTLFPNAVDLSAFPMEENAAPESGISTEAAGYRRLAATLPRPVIGYVGGLHRFVDFELLAALIRARPSWSWVFVGPHQHPVESIAGMPNVHLTGPQPHKELVHYIRSFDAGIVPYIKNAYTHTVVPVKINEYLALGKPVVSTDLAPVLEFNAMHQVLLTVDNRPEPFLQAIERALSTTGDVRAAVRRREVAASFDWQPRLEIMCAVIEDCMARPEVS